MNIEKLIEELKKYDKNLEVYCSYTGEKVESVVEEFGYIILD